MAGFNAQEFEYLARLYRGMSAHLEGYLRVTRPQKTDADRRLAAMPAALRDIAGAMNPLMVDVDLADAEDLCSERVIDAVATLGEDLSRARTVSFKLGLALAGEGLAAAMFRGRATELQESIEALGMM